MSAASARKGPPRPFMPAAGRRLVLTPPEGVPVGFALPEIGTRIGAQLIDLVVVVALSLILSGAFIIASPVGWEAMTVILSLFSLLFGTPFFILCELLWNGRTPGKRLLGIRVISMAGQGLSTHQIVVRNLLKEVEILFPLRLFWLILAGGVTWEGALGVGWGIAVLAVAIRSKARQRLGDFAAGTVVVADPTALLLPDLATRTTPEGEAGAGKPGEDAGFTFTSAQLDLYGAYELQVLEKLLHARRTSIQIEAMRDVSTSIHRKIGFTEELGEPETEAFLLAFYRAQRAYLEEKKLFGEARDDKHHKRSGPTGPAEPKEIAP